MKIIDLRAPEGRELEFFNEHNKKINELTNGLCSIVSVSGNNTRTCDQKKLYSDIRAFAKEKILQYKNAKYNNGYPTNGSRNTKVSLIIIQNYGYGFWGVEEDFVKRQDNVK